MTAKSNFPKVLVCLVLALGTALLYLPTLHFDFVNYDDPIYVIDNFHIQTLSWQSLAWCFQLGYASLWHPLTWMSHILDFHFYGLTQPGGHHATSVVFHILNSILLFLVLHRMTKALWPSAMVAALFAWHPLHVESVAWISERKDVLSAFFCLLTLWSYVRYVEQSKFIKGSGKAFYALALFFFALGLMAKPMIVTLPFVMLLLDWWPLQRVQSQPDESGQPRRALASLLVEKIPFVLLSLGACVLTLKAAARMVEPLAAYPLVPRLVNSALAYLRYVEKMIWPKDLVTIYPFEFHWSVSEVLLAVAFLVGVSVFAFRLRQARPYWATGWLLYLGMLSPVIGLVQVGAHPMADHNAYLPSIGIFLVVCWEAVDIAQSWPRGRTILGIAAGVVLAACLWSSSRQIQYWRNPATLFTHNLAVAPHNYIARADYAAFLRDAMQLEAAEKECRIALQDAPDYAWSHQVLSGVYFLAGRYDLAEPEIRKALSLDPGRADAHSVLAQIALRQNSPTVAAGQYSLLLTADPASPVALDGLGQALAMQGKLDEARTEYEKAIQAAPQYPDAHHHLAVVLALQHDIPQAIVQYRTALQLQPKRPDTLNNLAWILATDSHAENRQGAQAVELAQAACKLTQEQNPVMTGTLAAAYAESGDFDQAVASALRARDLAQGQGNTNVAQRNDQLLQLYRAHQPYHEK